ncbi:MAG: hypothetical protein AB7S38_18770 [Vulcanimicrobiota bacterium]
MMREILKQRLSKQTEAAWRQQAEDGRRIPRLERELQELTQRIPFHDRLIFFVDSPDEAREQEVKAELEELRQQRRDLERTIHEFVREAAREFPLFGVSTRLESWRDHLNLLLDDPDLPRLGQQAAAQRHRREKLQARVRADLEAIRQSFRESVLPGLDLHALVARVTDHLENPKLASDSHDGLIQAVARRLAALDFSSHASHLIWLEQEFAQGQPKPELIENRNQALAEVHGLLVQAMSADPALRVYCSFLLLEAALAECQVAVAYRLDERGNALSRGGITLSTLVVALHRQLLEAFQASYPEVPFPSELLQQPAPEPVRGLSPFTVDLQTPLDEVIVATQALVGLQLALEAIRSRIKLIDRLVFWSDTPDEALEGVFEQATASQRVVMRTRWDEFLALARGERRLDPGYRLQDDFLVARAALQSVSTPKGETSIRRNCPLRNKAAAVAAADEMYQRVAGPFEAENLPGELRTLMYHMNSAEPYDGPFKPGKAVGYLAQRVGQRVKDLQAQAAALDESIQQGQRKLQSAQRQVSTWDKLNIFTQSEAEKAVSAEASQVDTLRERQTYLRDKAYQEFEQAVTETTELRAYYYAKELAERVAALKAQSGQRTTGYGKNKSTYYYCYIAGYDLALQTAAAYGSMLFSAYGQLEDLTSTLDRLFA